MDKMENAMSDEYEKHRQYEIKMEKQIMELRELVKMARDLIKEYEYSHYMSEEGINVCPDCGTEEDDNHESHCEFGKVLSRIDASEVMR